MASMEGIDCLPHVNHVPLDSKLLQERNLLKYLRKGFFARACVILKNDLDLDAPSRDVFPYRAVGKRTTQFPQSDMAAEIVNILDLMAPVPTFEPSLIRIPYLASTLSGKLRHYPEHIGLVGDGPVPVDSAIQRLLERLQKREASLDENDRGVGEREAQNGTS